MSRAIGFVGLALVIPALASAQGDRDVALSYVIAGDGRGMLIANPAPDAWGSVSWQRCPPDGSACSDVAADPAGDRILHVGDAVPGTVFAATASGNGTTVTRRSDPYQGRLGVTAAPRVAGRLRVHALVKPRPATWSGGWGSERDRLQLQVCRTRSGKRCRVISDSVYWNRHPGAGAILARRYRGWWVRVADLRLGRDEAFAAFGVTGPGALSPFRPGGSVATAIAGPVR